MKNIEQAPIKPGTKVFVAADIDVDVQNNHIVETFRLDHILPTLKYIIKKGGFPIIGGHRKQPHGKFDESLSTKFLQPFFEKNLGYGNFELLENLRFDIREEENDPIYTQELAQKADIYVNEIFSTSHREHASIVGVPKYIPGYAGFRLSEEIKVLGKILTKQEKPFIVIIGGAKIKSKKPVIARFVDKADYILIGGKIGLEWNEDTPQNVMLPKDYARDNKDIGPETIEIYKEKISAAKTVLWAGPMGAYEEPEFLTGTEELAKVVSLANTKGAFTLIGGGDTITAVNKIGYLDKFDFVSTGGGAMLKFLAEGTLPGIEVLGYTP